MPTTCWASSLGNCDRKLSREHLVSEGIWTGPTVQVSGLPWCRTEPKTIGLGALTAKVLCRRHNSELSPVDQAGIDAFSTIQRMADFASERSRSRPRKWKLKRFEIDGWGLERWFLKTLINIVAATAPNRPWSFRRTPDHLAPPEFVLAAFGRENLRPPLGLYAAAGTGDQVAVSERVELLTLLSQDLALAGGIFVFGGYHFLLYLDPGPLPAELLLGTAPDLRPKSLLYRLKRVNHKVGRWHSHYAQLLW